MATPPVTDIPADVAGGVALLRGAGVQLAILFGSRARGEVRAGSDWDIGVLGLKGERDLLAFDLRLALGANVDLVDLDRASPLLCDRAMREGRVLLDIDGSQFAQFASLTLRRYEDTAKLRRAQEESLRQFAARHGR